MRSRRYLKIIILANICAEGLYARDLVRPVSEEYGDPLTIQRISNTLSIMEKCGEVRKVPEYASGVLKRYKWFRNDYRGM